MIRIFSQQNSAFYLVVFTEFIALVLVTFGVPARWALILAVGITFAVMLVLILATTRRRRARLVYEDPYLRRLEEREQDQGTEEQKRLLLLFAAWLQVRKDVQLPDFARALTREFLALKRVPNPEEQ